MSENKQAAINAVKLMEIAKMKAHLYFRVRATNDKQIYKLAKAFSCENIRSFWYLVFEYGYLSLELKDMYDACQDFWYNCTDENSYMDVLHWNRVSNKIEFADFVKQMEASYKEIHAQQIDEWHKKYGELGEA